MIKKQQRASAGYPSRSWRSSAVGLLLVVTAGLVFAPLARNQSPGIRDLTAVVLINSDNPQGYNPDPANPGEFQRYPERYLEHLQIPYQEVDVATTVPLDLTNTQLIVAGHRGLNLSAGWQDEIVQAVQGGSGFVNLDWDTNVGDQLHIQTLFGATGSVAGTPGVAITIPADLIPGGVSPHYIAGMQRRWPSDPAGDVVYAFHPNDAGVTNSVTGTLLLGAQGDVVARLGSDPLILATSSGSGRAVHFGTYDYMKADRFGFMRGVDDLFWRSLVWAARKPFVVRGYPRFFSIQMDDNGPDFPLRVGDMYDTSLTGNVLPDGTGGPWKPTGYLQLNLLFEPSAQRTQMIQDVQQGLLQVSPHGNFGGTGGDLYWNLTVPNSDAQWLAYLDNALAWKQGTGGSDTIPFISRSMVPHFWDLSNNAGFDMWNSLGQRYITIIQKPGSYYLQQPSKTEADRLNLRPFRLYELPPLQGNPNETWPIYYADELTVESRAGLPSKTFFAFCTQLLGFRYPRQDALWPNAQNGWPLAESLENFQYYAWRFWSGMAPVQIYTHDDGNYRESSVQNRQALISQLSSWMNARGVRHVFMEDLGDYFRARNKSFLVSADATTDAISLTFTGDATDADGNKIPTKVLAFYGDDDGTWVDVPGFAGGLTVSFPNETPPAISVDKSSLEFGVVPGEGNPSPQDIQLTNGGGGTLEWFASTDASWLTVTPESGTSPSALTAAVEVSGLVEGDYQATITVTGLGASNSPQIIDVSLSIRPPTLGVNPTVLIFDAFQGQGNPPSQELSISNEGGGTVDWTATVDVSWLSLSAASGTAPGAVTVSANATGLGIGTFNGNITITAPGADSSPQVIPVTMTVRGLLLFSDFNAGSTAGWATSPLGNASGWSLVSGALQYNGSGHTQVYAGNAAWGDYELEVKINLATLNNYPGGIRGRVDPVSGASYAVWLYPGDRVIRLYRNIAWNIDAGFVTLGQAVVPFNSGSFHKIKISFQGSNIQVFYDDASVIVAQDAVLPSGMVALDVSNQTIAFDDVIVTGSTPTVGSLSVSTNSLSFAGDFAGANPPSQTLAVSSLGGSVAWTGGSTVPWITLSPSSGATAADVQVSVNTAGLAGGNYTGQIQLASLGALNSPQIIDVNLSITVPPPQVALSATFLSFTGATGQPAPPSQSLVISNGGFGEFSWTATTDASWLSLSQTSGTTPSPVDVIVDPAGLALGVHAGSITVSADGIANSPQVVPVSFRVMEQVMLEEFTTDAAGWIASPLGRETGWSASGGLYTYGGVGHTQSCAGNGSWTDYTFDTSVRLSSLANFPGGVRGRVNPGSGAGYGVWLYPGDGLMKLFRIPQWNIDGGGVALVEQAAVSFDTAFHTLGMDFQGSQITVSWDGTPLIVATDAAFSGGFVCMDVSNRPISYDNVSVLATQSAVTLSATPASLAFQASGGGGLPAPQTVDISAGGDATTWAITTDALWLTATASTTVTPGTVTVTVDPAGLTAGTHTGAVTLIAPGGTNSPLVIPVSMTINDGFLAVSPASLDFLGTVGGNPAGKTLDITNGGGGALSWTASTDVSWLVLSATSGTAPSIVTVTPDISALVEGQYSGTIEIVSSDAGNSPVTVPVTLDVRTLLFGDNFDSGTADDWLISPLGRDENWSVVNGAYTYNGGGHTQSFTGSQAWTDYSFSVDFTLSSLSNYPGGIRGRVDLTNGSSYGVWVYPGDRVVKLFRITAWSIDSSGLTLLGQSGLLDMDAVNPHNLRLSFQGSAIQVFYDNTLVVEATDTAFTGGGVALDVSNRPIQFDNVMVTSP